MKILGNSTQSLIPQQKQLLYRRCILSITLYSFQLWLYKKVPLLYPLRKLNKIQHRAAIWILGIFHTSPSFGIKAIAGLISINLHFYKLSDRAQLRAHSLLHNHILQSLLELRSTNCHDPHCLFLNLLTHHQRENIKGTIVDMNNRSNKIFSSLDLLNKEFFPNSHLIDIFPSHFSFHPFNKCSNNNLKDYSH